VCQNDLKIVGTIVRSVPFFSCRWQKKRLAGTGLFRSVLSCVMI
jgi:hypothetical protein